MTTPAEPRLAAACILVRDGDEPRVLLAKRSPAALSSWPGITSSPADASTRRSRSVASPTHRMTSRPVPCSPRRAKCSRRPGCSVCAERSPNESKCARRDGACWLTGWSLAIFCAARARGGCARFPAGRRMAHAAVRANSLCDALFALPARRLPARRVDRRRDRRARLAHAGRSTPQLASR